MIDLRFEIDDWQLKKEWGGALEVGSVEPLPTRVSVQSLDDFGYY